MLGACGGKSSDAENLPPVEIEGVKVDMPKLSAEFAEAPPELRQPVNNAMLNMRYRKYVDAMMELDKVLKEPSLNDKQKQLITQVMDQLKQVAAKAPATPGQ
jgi:hypothetical protein